MKMSNRLRALGIALALLAAPASGLAAQDLDGDARQRLFYEIKPATVLVWLSAQADIQIPSDDGVSQMQTQIGSSGSGWIISPDGYLITNGHVVELYQEENEDQLRLQMLYQALEEGGVFATVASNRGSPLSDQEKVQMTLDLSQRAQISIRKSLDVYLQNWQRLTADIRAYSPPMSNLPGKTSVAWQGTRESGNDVAVLKVAGRDLPTVRIGDSDGVEIGEEVFVAGYPGTVFMHPYLSPESQMEASFTRGQVSSVKVAMGGSEVIQMDAQITYGNSGGPVFNGQGEVVGMATFGSVDQTGPVQGFNFAVPTSVIQGFIRSAGAQTGESMFDRTWRAALDDYYGGDYGAAIEGFDEAIRVLPNLGDALQLRRNAMQARDRGEGGTAPGPAGGIPTWAILAAVAVGALLVGSGLMAKRGSPAAAKVGGGSAPRARASAAPAAGNGAGHLVAQAGTLAGNRFSITPAGVKIGRDPSACQVVLSDSNVSREHALILASGDGVTIKNLSGTNPTYVNDRAIQEATLRRGDRIKIGGSVFSLEA